MKSIKLNRTLLIVLGITIISVATIGVIWAVTQWTYNFDWGTTGQGFSVWTASEGGTEIITGDTQFIGENPTTYTAYFYIQNDEDVNIQITVTATSTATVAVSPASTFTVPTGTTRVPLTITLSDFSTGSGSCQITLTSAVA